MQHITSVRNIFIVLLLYKCNYIVLDRLLSKAIEKMFLFFYLWTAVEKFIIVM